MKKYIIILWVLKSIILSGQTVQKGSVVEMNSNNKPVAGVAITAIGAIPADTDGNGAFQLVFSKAKSGSQVVVSQIHKMGFELVNEEDVKNWTLSATQPFKIVLCKSGMLEVSRRNFYNIGQDRYYKLYIDAREKLNEEKNANTLSQTQYAFKMQEIMEEYERAMSQLTFYADKFSRINKDDLNEMDAKALSLMEEGKVEEAIQVYEDAEILNKFKEKVSQRDTALYNADALASGLEKELLLLKEKNDEISFIKADSIYRTLIIHNKESFVYNFDYALLLMEKNKTQECFPYLKQALLTCKNEEEKKKVEASIQQFFTQIDDCERLEEYKSQLKESYMILEEKEEIENLKKYQD